MATTRIMPLHIGKGRTESQAVSDIIDYVSNPQKTDNGRLVTGFACDSRVRPAEKTRFQLPLPRSIFWWIFRQNCRPEKALATRAGQRYSI